MLRTWRLPGDETIGMKTTTILWCTLLTLGGVRTASASGPTSAYYVVAGVPARMFKLQASNVLFDVGTVDFDYPIAVSNTIRTTGDVNDNVECSADLLTHRRAG